MRMGNLRTKEKIGIILTLAMVILFVGCSVGNDDDQKIAYKEYEDMEAAFEESDLMSANIGIFSRTEEDGSVTYGEGGSGVIVEKKDGTYYALTCAHVVSAENTQLLVFTIHTEMKMDHIPGVDLKIPSLETYESMYPAETVYVSKRDDLAVIRFSADEELSVIELAESDPEINDRIMCVGNPQNEWFAVSYGKVTSGIEKFGEAHGFPSNAMRHSAYINVGSSGGAAFNEQMQLVGITPGISSSIDGKEFKYGVLIPASEIRICMDEWTKQ